MSDLTGRLRHLATAEDRALSRRCLLEAIDTLERLQAENQRLRENEWTYDSLERILRDELPLTMTLGLAVVLVERMVRERMFKERVDGVSDAMRRAAEQALAERGEG